MRDTEAKAVSLRGLQARLRRSISFEGLSGTAEAVPFQSSAASHALRSIVLLVFRLRCSGVC